MNSLNFFNDKKRFPVSTQVLEFLQNMIKQAHKLALIGGADKYILTGCNSTAVNTWAPGYVVVNGEILPFLGGTGTLESSVRLKQIKTDIVAEYDTYEEALTDRYLEFGSNVGGADTYVWSEFVRVKTNLELAAQYATKEELTALADLLKPVGDITMYCSATNLPAGHMLCDGISLNRDDYPALFAKIGTTFGSTSATTFNLPDLRGRFVIGLDTTTPNLPANVVDNRNADGTVVKNYGAIGNRGGKHEVQLTKQESGLPDFQVDLGYNSMVDGSGSDREGFIPTDPASHFYRDVQGKSASMSHENRPPYFVLAYIIKVV